MDKTRNGAIWSAIERFSVQGSQFILSLIIARLVTPADFGLIAMISIFIAIAQVFTDSGFGSALIQKKDRNTVDYSTVFYFNSITSIILYIILFLIAPYISKFYNTPQLTNVTRVVGINLILMALCLIQRTIYRIELNFKKIAKISLVAMILSGLVGIILAYKGYGVWALVFQTLGNNLLLTVIFWISSKWHPILKFSRTSFKRLFTFGSKLLISHLLHTIFLNLYSLVLGRFYNPTDVGYYNRAYTISQYPPVNLVTIITNVMYPLQCNHQDNKQWMITTFPKFIRLTCFVVFPIMILLAIVAKPFTLIVLSDKWLTISPLISILSIAYMWIAIGALNNNIINSSGRSDLYLKAEILKKVIAILILLTTLPFGLIWLCLGLLLYNIIDLGIIIWFTKKIYPLGYEIQFKAFCPILLLSLISAAFAYPLSLILSNCWILIISQTTIFLFIYILGSKYIATNELSIILSMITPRGYNQK